MHLSWRPVLIRKRRIRWGGAFERERTNIPWERSDNERKHTLGEE